MKIIKEFKEFAINGNMFDMAIGIIIGVAFNKIVSSLVNDIILPFFSIIIGEVNFQNLKLVLQEQIVDNTGVVTQELVAINYGNFIQVLFDFSIIAITLFLVIKMFNKLRRKALDEKDITISTPKNIELLSEIRDLLKEK
ncbi:large-conductance mechanosensitive channel protein MscL [Ancylomarina sp. 16SWW S1-10-2]|uniref:large-conductance mechanosensitive channel protein MscL n=1 Tax=Ancylomarina sp. 16SWW S1-10-2 TaxID=2499681 RepID=UPI0012AE4DC8|nr:large-conductance mechanosensitive channel protein MscL [Ancylomarina sp. 16SWW S1-10-2]MRT93933.1 large-conductance mechanosensitive channel protein MscL [Ancylomarina sp. 16SWW S1-10-2]